MVGEQSVEPERLPPTTGLNQFTRQIHRRRLLAPALTATATAATPPPAVAAARRRRRRRTRNATTHDSLPSLGLVLSWLIYIYIYIYVDR